MSEKKIRLLQAARQMGVGLATITDFLAKKGISVENSPNTPISPEIYEVIEREFGGGRPTGSSQNIRERLGGLRGDTVSLQDRKETQKQEEYKEEVDFESLFIRGSGTTTTAHIPPQVPICVITEMKSVYCA